MMHIALTSRFAIIRQCAARCFATLCDVMTSEAMRYVIENIVPLLGDPLVLANRQGATELMYRASRSVSRSKLWLTTTPIQMLFSVSTSKHCPTSFLWLFRSWGE